MFEEQYVVALVAAFDKCCFINETSLIMRFRVSTAARRILKLQRSLPGEKIPAYALRRYKISLLFILSGTVSNFFLKR